MTAARRRHQAWIRTLPFVSCGIDGRNEAGYSWKDRDEQEGVILCVRPVVLRLPHAGVGAYHRVSKRERIWIWFIAWALRWKTRRRRRSVPFQKVFCGKKHRDVSLYLQTRHT